MRKLIQSLSENPRHIFLFDAFGAFVTALSLGFLLVRFEHVFGIPSSTLYLLAVIPILYCLYDFYAYKQEDKKLSQFLRGIAILNLSYCGLSLALSFYHYDVITIWGWFYVLIEIAIIVALSLFELRIASRLNQS